jgi:3-oxoadipate enol-lactonase
MTAWFDVHGEGPAVGLVHAGIADSRMWEPQLRTFSDAHRVVRVDLPGFGNSPFESNIVSYRGAIGDALQKEEAALAKGDLDAAVTANLRLWIAGPRRTLDDVDPHVQDLVAEMQTQAFRLGKGHDDRQPDRLEPPASTRLADIQVPTLVITGDEDIENIHAIADRLAREIPLQSVRRSPTPHLPSLERPEEFDRIVLRFLGEHGV